MLELGETLPEGRGARGDAKSRGGARGDAKSRGGVRGDAKSREEKGGEGEPPGEDGEGRLGPVTSVEERIWSK